MSRWSKFTDSIRRFFNFTYPVYSTAILLIVFLATAYPFLYIILYSFSDSVKAGGQFLLLPVDFNVDAYRHLFSSAQLKQSFLVSVGRSTIGPVITTFVCMMAAYPLSKVNLPGRRMINTYFVLTMYFGAGLIPYYLVIKNLGLIGTFWVYILPSAMSAYNMIILRSYIGSIASEIFESAEIDGANDWTVFIKIVFPVCMPVVAAVFLFACVGQWNSYTDTLYYNSSNPELYPLQYYLMTIVSSMNTSAKAGAAALQGISARSSTSVTTTSIRMAMTVLTVVPISLVYPFLQRYFVKGIMIGAVKG